MPRDMIVNRRSLTDVDHANVHPPPLINNPSASFLRCPALTCKLVCDGRDIYGMGRLRRLNTNPAIWGLLARFFREPQLVFVRQAR